MATTDYYQQYLSDIVGGMMPNIQTQKKGMYDFLLSNALRTGQSAQSVQEGMRPYAESAGQAAAEAGVDAAHMAQKQEQFDVQQENWQKQFDQAQANWQQQMQFQQEQQDMANMMSMFEYTGWTPELLDAMGYSGRDVDMWDQFQQPGGGGPGGGGSQNPWDVPGTTYGAWNNWGGKTGLIYG